MKKVLWLVAILVFSFSFSGCAVYKASAQPGKKDLSVLSLGTHRDLVLAEFGTPAVSGKDEAGNNYDLIVFVQGYSKANKIFRSAFHFTADIFTLGLWEGVATPIEWNTTGTRTKIRVTYDSGNRVSKVEILEPKPDEEKKEEKPFEPPPI